MRIKNTIEQYGMISKSFHWLIAALMFFLFYSAYTMMDLPPSDDKWQYYSLHKSIGGTVIILALFRLMWRLSHVVPAHPLGIPKWQMMSADLMHYFLYVLMFAMPISGYIMSTAGGHDVMIFGVQVPTVFGEKNMEIAQAARSAHTLISYLILAAVAGHAGAALWHHFVLKNTVLKRMFPAVCQEKKS